MAKKFLCMMMLILALLLAFVACDSDSSTDNTPDTPGKSDIPAHIHAFSEWETVKAASCTAEGRQEKECSCGEKKTQTIAASGHTYVERDGRVLCSECKELCVHVYEKQGSDMYCVNCMYKCKHNFKEANGQQICEYCNSVCEHDYELQNGVYKCVQCQKICSHNYEMVGSENVCTECGAKKIILTTENINEYLSVDCRYEFVEKVNLSLSSQIYIKGKIFFDIAPKKNVKFENLQVKVKFTTVGNGWSSSWNFSKTVNLPYDGNGSFVWDISSPMVSKAAILGNSPMLVTPEIIEVTGTIG